MLTALYSRQQQQHPSVQQLQHLHQLHQLQLQQQQQHQQQNPTAFQPMPAAPVPQTHTTLENTVIKNKWKLTQVLGKGAFGEVYLAIDLTTQQMVAIKVESPACKKPVLKLEVSIIQRLQDSQYICRFISCGRFISPQGYKGPGAIDNTSNDGALSQPVFSYLVMELLDQNISDLRKRTGGRFSIATTALLGKQMLMAIKDVHAIGILHRDIKPGNFCLARPGSGHIDLHGRPRCFLIDFGLSRRYLSTNGRVREARTKVGFRGTARYASIAAHEGHELARVDDLWSLFYIIVEFLTGTLPWKGREKDKIGSMKRAMTNPDLVRGLPDPILHLYTYISTLSYTTQPDYALMARIFDDLFAFAGVPDDTPYDWDMDLSTTLAAPTSPLRNRVDTLGGANPAGEISNGSISEVAGAPADCDKKTGMRVFSNGDDGNDDGDIDENASIEREPMPQFVPYEQDELNKAREIIAGLVASTALRTDTAGLQISTEMAGSASVMSPVADLTHCGVAGVSIDNTLNTASVINPISWTPHSARLADASHNAAAAASAGSLGGSGSMLALGSDVPGRPSASYVLERAEAPPAFTHQDSTLMSADEHNTQPRHQPILARMIQSLSLVKSSKRNGSASSSASSKSTGIGVSGPTMTGTTPGLAPCQPSPPESKPSQTGQSAQHIRSRRFRLIG